MHIPASIWTMTARSAPSNSFAGAGREAQTIVIATPAARAQACVTRFRTMFPLQIGLEKLFRHERCEQHVAELHGRRDIWLRSKNLLRFLAHESPFQAPSIGAECHQIRAVQAAHIDRAAHIPRELRTPHEDSELGIGAVGPRFIEPM